MHLYRENPAEDRSSALAAPQPGYLPGILAECGQAMDSFDKNDENADAPQLVCHYLRCSAFGLWSALQLKEPLPVGFFRRPEIRRLLGLAKAQKIFSVYYLPFRLHMARLSARLYAWDESRHINYWRAREILYRLFFRGWKK